MHKVQIKMEKLLSGFVQKDEKAFEPRQKSQSMLVDDRDLVEEEEEEEDKKLKKTFRGRQTVAQSYI